MPSLIKFFFFFLQKEMMMTLTIWVGGNRWGQVVGFLVCLR
jgi:hypothetical protein